MDRTAQLDEPARAALEVARAAASLVMADLPAPRGRKGARRKTSTDLVTRTDRAAERLIVARLRARFPGHAVLGEEGGAAAGDRAGGPRWIIDPIDGTANFARGVPWFAISIAFEEEGVVRSGIVAVPPLDELFVAERGRGAYQVAADGGLTRLRASRTAALGDALVATGLPRHPHRRRHVCTIPPVAQRALELRIMGAAAVHLAHIAAGRLEAFWEPGLFAWDVAAGVLLVEEAGGRVTDWEGGPLVMPGGRLLASNGALHPAMVRMLRVASGPRAPWRRGAAAAPRPAPGRPRRAARAPR